MTILRSCTRCRPQARAPPAISGIDAYTCTYAYMDNRQNGANIEGRRTVTMSHFDLLTLLSWILVR
jgi:hypothetical protein